MLASAAVAAKLGALMPIIALLPSALGWVFLGCALVYGAQLAKTPVERFAPWGWWLLLGGALLGFRWPLIQLPYELYPDESQLLAGAITLRHDPMFWRSVDGGTAGPLDYYALMPAAVFQGETAFAVTRLIAAGLIWGGLVAAGETIVLLTGCALARIAALPAFLFVTFTTSPEFIHYSSELVSTLLLALALLAMARREIRPTGRNLWAAALLLGSVPWAKLQAVPIATGLGLLLVIREFVSGRRAGTLLPIAAACVPTLFFLLLLVATNQTEHMVIPYILQNLLYVETGRLTSGQVSVQLWTQAVTGSYLAAWLAGGAAFVALAAWNLRRAPVRLRWLALGAAALLGSVIVCAFTPGRPYPHYLHLVEVPLTLLPGLLLAAAWTRSTGAARWTLAFFAGCSVLPPLGLKLSARTDPYAAYNMEYAAPNPARRALVAQVKAFARPGESLGLWGWRSGLYVHTGLYQATCQAHTESVVAAGPYHLYYIHRYLEKLIENSPPVFVDAVGPGNFRFTDRAFGHEILPFLGKWIGENYTLVADLDGCRVYVRRDRLPATVAPAVP